MNNIWLAISFVLGWLIAQSIKLVGGIIKQKGKIKFSDFMFYMTKSGGMPSGHTASFVGLDTALGFLCGFDSPIFVLAICTTIIIIYDAVNVRYAVGEQGKLLNELVEHHGHLKHGEKKIKIVEGHTVPQAIVGGFIGVAIGILVSFIAGWI